MPAPDIAQEHPLHSDQITVSDGAEPGCGTGVISLLLAKKHPRISVTAVEIDPDAADLCQRNVEANRLGGRVTVLNCGVSEIGTLFKTGPFDAVVANPPYRKRGSGVRSPLPSRCGAA